MLFVSATPNVYEDEHELLRAEQIIRPTGLLDPEVVVRPVEGQIDDLVGEVNKEIKNHHKVLITTLTKKMAEDLTDYMRELGIRVKYLHSDIDTLERAEIIRDLRLDVFDVLVGINLLREGLDIPEITLVAILDADKEGFLRSETSLIQTIGRAARNSEGHVIMYADTITDSMRVAIEETERRPQDPAGVQRGTWHYTDDDPEVGAGTDLCFQEDRKRRNEFQEVPGVDEQGGTDEADRRYPEKDGKSGGGSQFRGGGGIPRQDDRTQRDAA